MPSGFSGLSMPPTAGPAPVKPAEPGKPRKVGEEEEEYPHYEPFYRASSFAHPVIKTEEIPHKTKNLNGFIIYLLLWHKNI